MNNHMPGNHHGAGRRARGFSLIELMIAMVLGLIVIAGAGSVFLASSRTYQTNKALSEVQTNARIAFELLSRDIRNAGQNPCNDNGRVANVVNNQATDWYLNWANALHGYAGNQADPAVTTGTGVKQRVAGTSSVQLIGAGNNVLSVNHHNANSAVIFLNNPQTSLQDGDVVIVCDPDHSAIVQVQINNNAAMQLGHNPGVGSPGDCSKGLGYPTNCGGNANGNTYTFPPNSSVVKMVATDWYIGNNPVQGTSLYRIGLQNVGGTPTPVAQEMVRNVKSMKLYYHQAGNNDFVTADQVTNWSIVDAVRADLQIYSSDQRAGSGFTPITRSFTATTTIRNRVK